MVSLSMNMTTMNAYKIGILLILVNVVVAQAQLQNADYGNQPARLSPVKTLDRSELEVVYLHNVYDPVLDRSDEKYYMLQIGKNFSKYFNYGTYRLDSAIATSKNKVILSSQYSEMYTKYGAKAGFAIKDLKSQTVKVCETVLLDWFLYEEPIPKLEWELEEGEKTVCGQVCHKATTTFRGRQWVAWYSDVPASDGPWKFTGLPGLILEMEDSKSEHLMSAVIIRQSESKIGFTEKSYLKSNRKAVKKAKDYYIEHSPEMLKGLLQNPDGSEKKLSPRRLFYNPIELE